MSGKSCGGGSATESFTTARAALAIDRGSDGEHAGREDPARKRVRRGQRRLTRAHVGQALLVGLDLDSRAPSLASTSSVAPGCTTNPGSTLRSKTMPVAGADGIRVSARRDSAAARAASAWLTAARAPPRRSSRPRQH